MWFSPANTTVFFENVIKNATKDTRLMWTGVEPVTVLREHEHEHEQELSIVIYNSSNKLTVISILVIWCC